MKEQPSITIDCHFERNEKSPPNVEREISPKGRNDKGGVEVPSSLRNDRRESLNSRLRMSGMTVRKIARSLSEIETQGSRLALASLLTFSQPPLIREGDKSGITDDDVVEYLDPKDIAGFL